MKKKTLSILLVLTLTLGLLCSLVTHANSTQLVTSADVVSKSAILVRSYKDLPAEFISVLTNAGATIDKDTTIEILSVNQSEDTAICVTNVDNDVIEKDVYIAYNETEDGGLSIDNSLSKSLVQSYDLEKPGSYPPISWDGNYIVHATATTAVYYPSLTSITPYYKPYKCEFYYVNYTGVTVSSICVEYRADGFLFSYPGFEPLDLPEYEHIVPVYKANPVAGTTYSNTNYFVTDKVLNTSSGSPLVGQYLTFYNVVNGVEDIHSVSI